MPLSSHLPTALLWNRAPRKRMPTLIAYNPHITLLELCGIVCVCPNAKIFTPFQLSSDRTLVANAQSHEY